MFIKIFVRDWNFYVKIAEGTSNKLIKSFLYAILPYLYGSIDNKLEYKKIENLIKKNAKKFGEEIESITIPNEKVICIIKFKNWEMICEFYAISSFNTDYFCRGISKKLNRLYKIYIIPEYRKESLRKEIRR